MLTDKTLSGATIAGLFLTLICNVAAGQDVRAVMFTDANDAREAAELAGAKTYAPRNYERGEAAYAAADRDLELNRNLERIRTGIADAVQYFRTAETVATNAKVELASLIKTRNDAAGVDAALHDGDSWREAERNYKDAIVEFERGDAKLAARRATDAEAYYRQAELSAIKAAYLNEARRLLSQADKAKASRYAPKTFERATRLLAQAEKELTQNRYDTDQPRDLARQAQYEARHALYLANTLRQARKDNADAEDLILAGELPLQQIGAIADLNTGFDEGYESATAQIIAYVRQLQSDKRTLEQDLYERISRVETLESQLTSLEKSLGGIASQRQILEDQLARQAREREQFRRVESMFREDQAQVLRTGNDVIIRLVGTSFPVGKSTIEPGAYDLLTTLIKAIRIFPNAALRIEGHTDSYGGDAANMQLSRQRANSVRAYLLANMSIEESKITADGFGETRPIANNETRDGRARNRRIDVVIRPAL